MKREIFLPSPPNPTTHMHDPTYNIYLLYRIAIHPLNISMGSDFIFCSWSIVAPVL